MFINILFIEFQIDTILVLYTESTYKKLTLLAYISILFFDLTLTLFFYEQF